MHQNLNQSGIYGIKNKINGKIYIGSSGNIRLRWKSHRSTLKKQRGTNRYLQRAYNKYGLNSFDFLVIEFCDVSVLIKKEQYWLDFYKSYEKDLGYNLSKIAESNRGLKHSEEAREKIRKSKLGLKMSPEAKMGIILANKKAVYMFNLNGTLVKSFDSVVKAANFTGIDKGNISTCCRGKKQSSGGFMWSYSSNPPQPANGVSKRLPTNHHEFSRMRNRACFFIY